MFYDRENDVNIPIGMKMPSAYPGNKVTIDPTVTGTTATQVEAAIAEINSKLVKYDDVNVAPTDFTAESTIAPFTHMASITPNITGKIIGVTSRGGWQYPEYVKVRSDVTPNQLQIYRNEAGNTYLRVWYI